MAESEIIVCGKRYDVDHPVVTFEDEGGYSAYVPHRTDKIGQVYAADPAPGLEKRITRFRARRSMGRARTLGRLRQVVRQFVVHLDGCRDARMCFHVLHNQRGLSVHFMVDNDGTIYQTLDLEHCAFHAGGVNEISIGVELQNRGDAARYPNYYKGEERRTVTCRVHGHQFLAYDFTTAQYEAMTKLGRAVSRILDIPLQSPQQSGEQVWTTIPSVRRYTGYLGHYNIESQKWDPGPWDFSRLFGGIGSKVTFPLTPLREVLKQPEDQERFQREAAQYFDLTEKQGLAHFPVGPLGQSRLWHGGVHLPAQERKPVFAPFMGKIVAARMAPPCPTGSCNFILLRHSINSSKGALPFFSLLFHLVREEDNPWIRNIVPWLSRTRHATWRRDLDSGRIALLEEEVEAGEVIGHVGEAGPPGHRSSQVHFALFSGQEISRTLDPSYWEIIETPGRSRFCENPSIIERIDRPSKGRPRDRLLSRRELRDFFKGDPRREELRRVAVRHLSEWTPGQWSRELEHAPDFSRLSATEKARLIAQQVLPTLWWKPEVAAHAGLPGDGVIYSYHPIGFLVWYMKLSQQLSTSRTAGIESADRWEGKMAPSQFTVDSESAKGMIDEEDHFSGDAGRKLTLEDLVNGYKD